ncbi:MAG: SLC13 family permease [Sulfobacillus thermotolerans]|nr:SLC13 family permease [Sulfobacillus thermotolerans]
MQTNIVLSIFVIAMILLASNRVRIDLIGLIVLLGLGLTGVVPSSQLFDGFSSEAAILIAGMLALGEGLVASGVTEALANFVRKMGQGHERRLAIVLMIVSALPSAFISDVGLVGMFIPVVRSLTRRVQIPASRLLMPLGIAATFGGLLTMVGSAGNIVGNQALVTAGYRPLGIFGITPLGFLLLLSGVAFMTTIGRILLPKTPPSTTMLLDADEGHLRQFVSELKILPDSPLIGKSLDQVHFFSDHGITILRRIHDEQIMTVNGKTILAPNDILLVLGDVDQLLESDSVQWGVGIAGESTTLSLKEHVDVVELLLGHRAPWLGRTVVQLNLRQRYGISVLGIYRDGQLLLQRLATVRLRTGDILLVQGAPESVAALRGLHGLIPLNAPITRRAQPSYRLWLSPAILLGSLLLAAFGVMGLRLAIVLGVALMAGTGILSLSNAYNAIEWRIVVFVAGMIPLGSALISTGITHHMVHALALWKSVALHPVLMIAVLFVIAAILTQVLSNIATVLVMAPVAAELAKTLHLLPYPFVMAVIVAVSVSPLTPLANKVDLLIMGPGGFRYGDFLRLGIPLSLVMGIVTTLLIPIFFPFH